MRREGTIVRWDDAKGFGFIGNDDGAQDLFVHVRDYRSSAGQLPRQGLRVSFEDIHVGGKGPRAVAVQPAAEWAGSGRARAPAPPRRQPVGPPPRPAPGAGGWWALPLMAAYGLAMSWLVWQRPATWWLFPASLMLNLATFFAYWQDKYAAQQRRWRIKEETLHLWSLAGGWGGAWFAQQVLRHKSVKPSFRATYRATVTIHCAAAACGIWWFTQHS